MAELPITNPGYWFGHPIIEHLAEWSLTTPAQAAGELAALATESLAPNEVLESWCESWQPEAVDLADMVADGTAEKDILDITTDNKGRLVIVTAYTIQKG